VEKHGKNQAFCSVSPNGARRDYWKNRKLKNSPIFPIIRLTRFFPDVGCDTLTKLEICESLLRRCPTHRGRPSKEVFASSQFGRFRDRQNRN
jgi:hypothetical protein